MLCIISLFKRLACKRCGALSTYCLAEIINNQETIMSTDYRQIGPVRPNGEDINLFTQNFEQSDQYATAVGTVTLRNKGAETF